MIADERNFINGFSYWDNLVYIADILLQKRGLLTREQFDDALSGLVNKDGNTTMLDYVK